MWAVRVPDTDGAEYDLFFASTDGRDADEVAAVVSEAVRTVKAADPDDFTFEDLAEHLHRLGIEPVQIVNASEEW